MRAPRGVADRLRAALKHEKEAEAALAAASREVRAGLIDARNAGIPYDALARSLVAGLDQRRRLVAAFRKRTHRARRVTQGHAFQQPQDCSTPVGRPPCDPKESAPMDPKQLFRRTTVTETTEEYAPNDRGLAGPDLDNDRGLGGADDLRGGHDDLGGADDPPPRRPLKGR